MRSALSVRSRAPIAAEKRKPMSDIVTRFMLALEFGSDSRERFYNKINQLLSNGVNLDMALHQLQRVAERKKSTTLRRFYGTLRATLANGGNFGQALSPYLPSSEALMIETGANTGRLGDALNNTISMMVQQKKLQRAIIGSLSYPVMLFFMLIMAMYLTAVQIIPIFEQVIPLNEWRGLSLTVANVSIFIRNYGFFLLIALVAFMGLVWFSLANWTDRSRLLVEKIFPWNIYRLWQGSSFLLAVSSLMGAGVKLDEVSLRRLGRKTSPYLTQRINAILRQMQSGLNLGEAMHRTGYQFPDEDIVDDILIYAKLKGFDGSLQRITNRWIDDLIINITGLMKGVNTIMMFAVAIVIGSLIVSFYDLFQLINEKANR